MRAGFSQILSFNSVSISEVRLPSQKKRANHIADILLALQRLYSTPELSTKIEGILREAVGTKQSAGKGSKGLSLWEIFIFSQLRLGLNASYDDVVDLANHHHLVRGILGLQVSHGVHNTTEYSKSTVYDNLILLSEESLHQINTVIVELGHELFSHGKKKDQSLELKTDSFVVETDTHFPTDYRSIYESGRKCNELIARLSEGLDMRGWRQWKDNLKKLKSAYRSFGRITSSGGKNKAQRQQHSCNRLLDEGKKLSAKVDVFKVEAYSKVDGLTFCLLVEIEWFHQMLDTHIDQLGRRIIKGETIPHHEKVFSIFQPYTEWINKGKRNVEIGKRVVVTTDQYHLIVDYMITEKQQDKETFLEVVDRVKAKYEFIRSWSTDKGFSTKENKSLIEVVYPNIALIMPKKGKKNKEEKALEADRRFCKLKNRHNAVESNINELEHRGLNRCPDRSQKAFNKYVGLAVISYNLHKIGRLISEKLAQQKSKEKKEAFRLAA